MPNAIDLQKLLSLNRVIDRDDLHVGDPLDPVIPTPLLRDVSWYYGFVGHGALLAVTQRWQRRGTRYTDIAFSTELSEPEWTAEHRHAVVHEWAHIFCKHRGNYFVLWQRGSRELDDFDCFVNNYQERQCEYVSAFVLVRPEALKILRGETNDYVARKLDVPKHLVELRWWILGRFGR